MLYENAGVPWSLWLADFLSLSSSYALIVTFFGLFIHCRFVIYLLQSYLATLPDSALACLLSWSTIL